MKTSNDEISLESEYNKIKDMDIDNWEQVRGPRPWEEQSESETKQNVFCIGFFMLLNEVNHQIIAENII